MSLFWFNTYFTNQVSTDFLFLLTVFLPFVYTRCYSTLHFLPFLLSKIVRDSLMVSMCLYSDKIHFRQKKPTWKMKLILLIYYFYHGGRIFHLHVPTYLLFPKHDRFTLVKMVRTFTANFRFYQNSGKLTRKCCT